jgi:hypothetical protein
MQDYGTLSCDASALGAAGFVDNSSPIAGGVYLSNSSNGNVDTTGCDWGDDTAGDDNSTYDIQQAPRTSTNYCYPNAATLSDTVTCAAGTCTASTDATCP